MLEEDEQIALFDWAKMMRGKYPEIALMHHIPNEGKRTVVTGAKLKAMGMKKGVPDIFLPVPRGKYHGLYIELKREIGGKLSEEQYQWLKDLDKQGYAVTLCHGWRKAAVEIETYLKIRERDKE